VINIAELKSALEDGGLGSDGYRILEGPPDESTWCIKKQGKTWLVFYFERGTKWEMQRFKEESAACARAMRRSATWPGHRGGA
jgi:hypothetical protein